MWIGGWGQMDKQIETDWLAGGKTDGQVGDKTDGQTGGKTDG